MRGWSPIFDTSRLVFGEPERTLAPRIPNQQGLSLGKGLQVGEDRPTTLLHPTEQDCPRAYRRVFRR